MSKNPQQPQFDRTNFTLYTRDDFYTVEDIVAAGKNWSRQEVDEFYRAYRAAVDVGDHAAMAAMLADDGRGGNATFGFFHGREAYQEFLDTCWLEVIPNCSVWVAITGGRIVEKWCELLPGTPPGGGHYEYFGINEVIYAGEGRFRFMYSVPDLFGLEVLYARWKADGQHKMYGDIYPRF